MDEKPITEQDRHAGVMCGQHNNPPNHYWLPIIAFKISHTGRNSMKTIRDSFFLFPYMKKFKNLI